MITNSQIQGAWISKIKANASITALVTAEEVREDLWRGTDFVYPNIRVKLGVLTPTANNPGCNTWHSSVSLQVFIEQKSSKQADDIAGVVATEFVGKNFTANGVRVYGITLTSLVPADVPESDPNSWMASAELSYLVSPA